MCGTAHGTQTGLILAGGVNAADHAETLGVFAQSLRAQGHTVATLRSGDVRKDGAASAAALGDLLRCMLAQLTGDDVTEAVDMRPLEAWHAAHGDDKPVVSGLEWSAVPCDHPPFHIFTSERTARRGKETVLRRSLLLRLNRRAPCVTTRDIAMAPADANAQLSHARKRLSAEA